MTNNSNKEDLDDNTQNIYITQTIWTDGVNTMQNLNNPQISLYCDQIFQLIFYVIFVICLKKIM